jgi:hypothetical protein
MVYSSRYVEMLQQFNEHQARLFEEERALWSLERHELRARISELEMALGPAKLASRIGDFGSGVFSMDALSRHNSAPAATTEDRVWMGAGGNLPPPTRSFPESPDKGTRSSHPPRRLPSIQEAPEGPSRQKTVGFVAPEKGKDQNPTGTRRSSIPGELISSNLDGISFKPSALPPAIVEKIQASSPPPVRSPSPKTALGPKTPGSRKPAKLELPLSQLKPEQLLTKDAGHTPLARQSLSISTSESSTPTAAIDMPSDEEPQESRTSLATSQPPTERAISYFPPVDGGEDDDPELKGPLSLPPAGSADNPFLRQLDSKLEQAANGGRPPSPSTSSQDSPTGTRRDAGGDTEPSDESGGKEGGGPDSEPKLRLKSSTNFGTEFGANTCGRNI